MFLVVITNLSIIMSTDYCQELSVELTLIEFSFLKVRPNYIEAKHYALPALRQNSLFLVVSNAHAHIFLPSLAERAVIESLEAQFL